MKDGDQLVMIMEFVDGQSLSQRLKQGPIPIAEALTYIDQVLDALCLRACAARDPSRHQAGQHDADARRPREADRLRHRALAQRRRR